MISNIKNDVASVNPLEKKRKRDFVDYPDFLLPPKKRKRCLEQYNLTQIVQDVAQKNLFDLTSPYRGIENLQFTYQNKIIHIYPTAQVKNIFNDFYNNGGYTLNLNHYIASKFDSGDLNIKEDTDNLFF